MEERLRVAVDVPLVAAQRSEPAPDHVEQGNIVIAGHHEGGRRHAVEKGTRGAKLPSTFFTTSPWAVGEIGSPSSFVPSFKEYVAARAETAENAQATADKLADELAAALGNAVFSTRGESMEEVVGNRLKELGQTVAVAESCTGGLIGSRFTDVPGSSAYFLEGAITYSNEAKSRALGIDPAIIAKHGAVSSECAEAMAIGMRRVAGTDHAISVTGIAGPDGGTDEKPVGTVFIGYAGPRGTKSIKIVLPGDRYLIRWRASQAALDYLRRQLGKSQSEE